MEYDKNYHLHRIKVLYLLFFGNEVQDVMSKVNKAQNLDTG